MANMVAPTRLLLPHRGDRPVFRCSSRRGTERIQGLSPPSCPTLWLLHFSSISRAEAFFCPGRCWTFRHFAVSSSVASWSFASFADLTVKPGPCAQRDAAQLRPHCVLRSP